MLRTTAMIATVLAVGCQKPATPVPLVRVSLPAPTAAAFVAADAGPPIAIDFGPSGPLAVVPKVPPFESGGMMDHAFTVGWSADGKILGQCHQAVVVLCDFNSLDGKKEFAAALPDEPARDQKEKAIKARAASMRMGSVVGEWAFARDLEITWVGILGSQVTNPPVLGVLKVGARVRGEKASFAISLSEKITGYYDRIHPEAIALSPDGKYLGVVAHAYSGEYSDRFPAAIVPVARLAAQAYNDAGFAHHGAKDFSGAAVLFEKAASADPTFALPSYNLACAFARLGDPRTEAALREAISRGGDAVKPRAQKDADFEGLRSAPWFIAITK